MNRVAGNSEVGDLELVRRAQAGDAAAFAGLVTRYQDRIYNTCYRMCHQHADALDLTQTTLLKALEALPRFETRSNFFTWLFRIAVNVSITHRRSQRRHSAASLDAGPDDARNREPAAADDGSDTVRGAEHDELCVQLEAALLELGDGFRAAVVLKDIEDMDYATIAEILAVPVGTVKSRIHRGRAMLRALLTAKEV